jgi:hypothetical protein
LFLRVLPRRVLPRRFRLAHQAVLRHLAHQAAHRQAAHRRAVRRLARHHQARAKEVLVHQVQAHQVHLPIQFLPHHPAVQALNLPHLDGYLQNGNQSMQMIIVGNVFVYRGQGSIVWLVGILVGCIVL